MMFQPTTGFRATQSSGWLIICNVFNFNCRVGLKKAFANSVGSGVSQGCQTLPKGGIKVLLNTNFLEITQAEKADQVQ